MADLNFRAWLPQGLENYETLKTSMASLGKKNIQKLQRKLWQKLDNMRAEVVALKPNDYQLQLQKTAISALLTYEMAKVTEKTEKAKQLYKDAWDIVGNRRTHPDFILLSISILRGQFDVYISQNRMDDVRTFSKDMSRIYDTVERTKSKGLLSLSDLFLGQEQKEQRRSQHIAEHIHNDVNALNRGYFDSVDNFWLKIVKEFLLPKQKSLSWSELLNQLSTIMIDDKEFLIARRILSCMTQLRIVCKDHFAKLKKHKKDEICVELRSIEMEISHRWGNYAVKLFEHTLEVREKSLPQSDKILPEHFNNLGSLPLDEVRQIESQVSYAPVNGKANVKALFLFGLRHLNNARMYYTSNSRTNHQMISISISKLYGFMAVLGDNDVLKMYMRSAWLVEIELLKEKVDKVCVELMFYLTKCYFHHASKIRQLIDDDSELPDLKEKKQQLAFLVFNIIHTSKSFLDHLKRDNDCTYNFIEQILEIYTIKARAHVLAIVDNEKKMKNADAARECYRDYLKHIEKYPEQKIFMKMTITELKEEIIKLSGVLDERKGFKFS